MKRTMKRRSLEVTYRKGRAIAAYLWLPRQQGDRSSRTEERAPGLLVDFAADGRAIGIELMSPATVSPSVVDDLLQSLHEPPLDAAELKPLALTD